MLVSPYLAQSATAQKPQILYLKCYKTKSSEPSHERAGGSEYLSTK